MGEELSNEDVAPVQVEGGEIEMVEHFLPRARMREQGVM